MQSWAEKSDWIPPPSESPSHPLVSEKGSIDRVEKWSIDVSEKGTTSASLRSEKKDWRFRYIVDKYRYFTRFGTVRKLVATNMSEKLSWCYSTRALYVPHNILYHHSHGNVLQDTSSFTGQLCRWLKLLQKRRGFEADALLCSRSILRP